ncbi:MAG: hypothetical protein OIF32_10420, partial [Campylobacterales bacterium]|nr:hypothetical protein [Campylobacterales bacterium]
ARGEKNFSDEDHQTIINILKSYNATGEKGKRAEVIKYIDTKILNKDATPALYNKVTNEIEKLIEKAITEKNKADFSYLVDVGYSYAKNVPTGTANVSEVLYTLFNIIPYTAYVDKFTEGQELINIANSYDSAEVASSYSGEIFGFEILKNPSQMDANVTNFDVYADTGSDKFKTRRGILENGLGLALVKAGKVDKAVKLIVNNFQYRDKVEAKNASNYPQVLKYFAKDQETDLTKLLGLVDTDKQDEFMEKIFIDSKDHTKPAWDFYRNKGGKYPRDKNKDMVIALFDGSFSSKTISLVGYPVLIKNFIVNNNIVKAKEVINYSLDYINNNIVSYVDTTGETVSPNLYKVKATIALITALDEVEYFKKVSDEALRKTLFDNIKTLAPLIDLDNTDKEFNYNVRRAIKVANFLSNSQGTTEAKELLDKLNTNLPTPTDNNLDEIETYLGYVIGDILPSGDLFDQSIVNAFISAKDYKKAEELIDSVKTKVDTLDSSLDINPILVKIARAYGAINKKEKAIELVKKITTIKERNQGKLKIAEFVANYDSFPDTDVASIDTDQDGKPDFFNKFATKEEIDKSKLTLDDDIDGDGILDTEDKLPFYESK